jgi:hypothetical protein
VLDPAGEILDDLLQQAGIAAEGTDRLIGIALGNALNFLAKRFCQISHCNKPFVKSKKLEYF